MIRDTGWLAAGTAALVGAVACGSGGTDGVQSGPAAAPDTVTGTVRQVGAVPFVRTVVQGTDTVTVTGRLEQELSRLSGARVRAVGEVTTGEYPGPQLAAAGYDILSVDGERPEVGILRAGAEGYYLERAGGEDRVELSAVSATLQEKVGAKVWVVTGADGTVRRYGILREAP